MRNNRKTYYTEHYPPNRLTRFINGFTLYHFINNNPVMLHPEGTFELILQLNGSFNQTPAIAENWKARPNQFIGGLHNKSFLVKPEKPGSQLISISFKPNCARYFIPDKLNLFKNKIADLEEVFQNSILDQIQEQISQLTVYKVTTTIESFLIKAYRDRPKSPVDIALNQIYRDHGFVNISQLAQLSCLSTSHLRKRFNEEVGMSPKEYSKIVRVNHITGILSGNPKVQLTDLTYRLGYFDQAHFIKDFKSVTGMSPRNFIQ